MIETRNLTLDYGGPPVIDHLDFVAEPGTITTLIGPNGCGKSTLLRALARLHGPRRGAVLLDVEDLRRFPARALAQRLGFLPQHAQAPEGLTVADLVSRGRFPHRGLWEPLGPADRRAIEQALDDCGLRPWADRRVDELSGGQRQRAWIALTLAQETPMVLLDEPTTYLDSQHQTEVLDLVVRLNRQRGTTFVVVLHDLAQAGRISDRVVALRGGAVVAAGSPAEVLRPSLLGELFGVPFDDRGPVPGVVLGAPPARGTAPTVEARNLVAGYQRTPVVGPWTQTLGPGGLTVVVGPNGCGKSTLLRTLAGLHPALGGEALVDGQPVARRSPRRLAALRSFVRQDSPLPPGFRVDELLEFGTFHRRGLWGRAGIDEARRQALEALDLGGQERRPLEALSGGQRQRVWLALALVQNAPVVLLDEPTSFLDPRHQRDLMDALWTLTRRSPTTVVAILHEPELAQRYADRIIDLGASAGPPGPR